jgi:DNA repair exonuclease SbcCD ATPase subunit
LFGLREECQGSRQAQEGRRGWLQVEALLQEMCSQEIRMVKIDSEEPETVEIYSKTCPVCGKKISSLYKRQLDSNMKSHLRRHKKKKK